jgi:hypothetical protein
VEASRKGIAFLSVLLVLTAFRCMATCIVNDTGASLYTPSSTTVPPCHRHHLPAKGTQTPAPCQNHPGLVAYNLQQPSAHVDAPVNLLAVVYEPAPFPRGLSVVLLGTFPQTSPLPRSVALSSIVLRI